jgi:hypothetical protein
MRPLELNLASRPFRNNVPIWTAHGVLLAVVVAFSAWNMHAALDASAKLDALQADLGSVERRLADLDRREEEAVKGARVFDPKTMQIQADKANDIILRRGLSWTRLFNTLERVVPYEVRMTAVRPVYGTRQAGSTGPRRRSRERCPWTSRGSPRASSRSWSWARADRRSFRERRAGAQRDLPIVRCLPASLSLRPDYRLAGDIEIRIARRAARKVEEEEERLRRALKHLR